MSTTDALALASALFDDAITPIAAGLRAAGRWPFPLGPDADRQSYFEPLTLFSATLDMQFPGAGTPEGLIDALAEYYATTGDPDLAAVATGLHPVAAALRNDEADSGQVDILCYTMF